MLITTYCTILLPTQSLAPGDIMKCRVLVKKNHGIVVRLLSFVHMLKNRELVDLRIKVGKAIECI